MTIRSILHRRSTCALLAGLLLAAGSAAAARPNWAAQHSRDNLAARLLDAHNAERAPYAAPPLAWDASLAAAADAYAAELSATGRFGHSAPHQRADQGENLWMGSRGAFSLEHMLANWASEKRMFRAGVFPNVSTTGRWEDVGHYSQIIWPGTLRVGCGLRSSARTDYLVCRYSGPGNVMGQAVPAPVKVASTQRRPSWRSSPWLDNTPAPHLSTRCFTHRCVPRRMS